MANSFSKKTLSELQQLTDLITTKLSGTNPYGVAPTVVTSLGADNTALTAAIAAQTAARAAERTAILAKATKRDALVRSLTGVAATVYANSAVTDGMLLAIGLEPRPSGRAAPVVPITPSSLVVQPFANGTVKFKWGRNGNKPGATYMLETSLDGMNWTLIDHVKRTSYEADGFEPGQVAWFRVSAVGSTGRSAPTARVPIYAPAPQPVQLRVA